MDSNPYRPSSSGDDALSLLDLLRYLFASKEQRRRAEFARGNAIVFEGIAFFVDPHQPSVLYAASPSSEISDARMNLVVSEVVRLTPEFAGAHGYLSSLLDGRKIVVRLIERYADNQTKYLREEPSELDLLN